MQQTPKFLKFRTGIKRVVVTLVQGVGIVIVVIGLPSVVEDDSKQGQAGLINQCIQNWIQIAVRVAPVIRVYSEAIHVLIRLASLDGEGSRAEAGGERGKRQQRSCSQTETFQSLHLPFGVPA